MVNIIKRSECNKKSVKLLQGVTIAFTISLTGDKVRLVGNWIFDGTYKVIECNRKQMTQNMKAELADILNIAKYTKVRVNKKDVHDDTIKLAAMFTAAKH
jgi:hypothetical protein